MIDSTTPKFQGPALLALVATLALAVGFFACGGGGNSPTVPIVQDGGGSDGGGGGDGGTETASGDDKGVLRISMKDDPIDDVSELQVFITGLRVKPDGGPVVNLPTNTGLYDLLLLTDGVTELLVATEVDTGIYQFIEILLDEDQSYVVETATGLMEPLQIASEKVKLNGGPFEVFEGGTTSVLFDFDGPRSLKQKGNGDWLLKPFVNIEQVVEAAGEEEEEEEE